MGAPGCDDAPVVEIELSDYPRPVTLINPYYDNPRWFAQQLFHWRALPDDLKAQLSIIVVDDGSPDFPAEDVVRERGATLGVRSFRLFRIEVDVRWNWLAARNIAAHHADDGWLALTDIDHVVPGETLRTLVFGRFNPDRIYRFSRREHTGQAIHPHPNSWFMTRQMYWMIGGYDEACSGYYGTDGDYRRRCAAAAAIRIMADQLVRYEYVDDSSTTRYKRKQPEDRRGREIMRARKRGWKPKTLSFPYHEIQKETLWPSLASAVAPSQDGASAPANG
jgi:hypothetical protein